MNEELQAKIIQHFKSGFEKSLFECSMGETHPSLVSAKAVQAFLAQAITYWIICDPRFAATCVSLSKHFLEVIDRDNPKNNLKSSAALVALHYGAMIELAMNAAVEINDGD